MNDGASPRPKIRQNIGVQDWVARGYVIPGGASQGWVGQALAFHVARCQIGTQVGHL